jgi:hypothetical protein
VTYQIRIPLFHKVTEVGTEDAYTYSRYKINKGDREMKIYTNYEDAGKELNVILEDSREWVNDYYHTYHILTFWENGKQLWKIVKL